MLISVVRNVALCLDNNTGRLYWRFTVSDLNETILTEKNSSHYQHDIQVNLSYTMRFYVITYYEQILAHIKSR